MARISQEIKEQTKECILREAETLFNTLGYDQTKTKTIAKACHIAEGTLFNYFDSKEAILLSVFEKMATFEDSLDSTSKMKEDILIEIILKPINKMKTFSKPVLMDLMTASLRLAKKNRKLFDGLVALDYRYIEDLNQRFSRLLVFNDDLMTPNDLSEIIYAVVASEFILYLYEQNRTYFDFEQRATKKIKALLKPYIGG